MKKSSITALFLSLISGLGHIYLGRKISGFFYLLFFIGPIGLAIFFTILFGYTDPMVLLVISLIVWIICMIDISITLLRRGEQLEQFPVESGDSQEQSGDQQGTVNTTIILLSFIPGAGHFYLGLMQRGLVIMMTFFGLLTLISLLSTLTRTNLFFVFLFALPVIWIYSLFDSIHLSKRKDQGEVLEDSIEFSDLTAIGEASRKNKLLYFVLSVIPGAGHLFLGKTTKGMQLMAVFFLSIFIINELRLSLFLFLLPLLWFCSFFDVMKLKEGVQEDTKWMKAIPKWLGISLLIVGIYYLLVRVAIPVIDPYLSVHLTSYVFSYVEPLVGSIILIAAGVFVLKITKSTKPVSES